MTRFHLCLDVVDLTKSVAFYQVLFGVPPAKLRSDYAKFETDDPPLVISLEPSTRAPGAPLNHVGFRLDDVKTLVAMQTRLEAAGLPSQREAGVECCYAKQTKFWLHDPDGTLWEFYTIDGDIEQRGAGQTQELILANRVEVAAPKIFEHRMGSELPEQFPFDDQSLQEVQLRGTFNTALTEQQSKEVLAEARRVLQPNGRIFLHVLTGERTLTSLDLPGAASMVQSAPSTQEVLQWLETSGFVNSRLLKYGVSPCFIRNGVALRETQIEAFTLGIPSKQEEVIVIYRGPFRSVMDDEGREFIRGQAVVTPKSLAMKFQDGTLADSFTVMPVTKVLEASACST